MAAMLLEHGARIDAKDLEGQTPLHLAAAAGNADMVGLLLDHDARIDAKDRQRETPLGLATRAGTYRRRYLVAGPGRRSRIARQGGQGAATHRSGNGRSQADCLVARTRRRSRNGGQAATHAAARGRCPRIIPKRPRCSSSGARTPMRATRKSARRCSLPSFMGNSGLPDFWSNAVSIPRPRMAEAAPPLYAAVENRTAEAARWLVDLGAAANHRDHDGATPLHAAAARGSQETIGFLIGRGADVHARDNQKRTPAAYRVRARPYPHHQGLGGKGRRHRGQGRPGPPAHPYRGAVRPLGAGATLYPARRRYRRGRR